MCDQRRPSSCSVFGCNVDVHAPLHRCTASTLTWLICGSFITITKLLKAKRRILQTRIIQVFFLSTAACLKTWTSKLFALLHAWKWASHRKKICTRPLNNVCHVPWTFMWASCRHARGDTSTQQVDPLQRFTLQINDDKYWNDVNFFVKRMTMNVLSFSGGRSHLTH